jgi:hypothetical protein
VAAPALRALHAADQSTMWFSRSDADPALLTDFVYALLTNNENVTKDTLKVVSGRPDNEFRSRALLT